MNYLFWLAGIFIALVIAAVATVVFAPLLKKLIARTFPEDVRGGLLVFAVIAIVVSAISNMVLLKDYELQALDYGFRSWTILFFRLYVAAIESLGRVVWMLAYILVAACVFYLIAGRRNGVDTGVEGSEEQG